MVESEETRARLGAARTEKERLERAVDAYARFLGQSRPDSMVSDPFHEPPAPAPAVADEQQGRQHRSSPRPLTTARPAAGGKSHRA
ncbi:hypothetical protein ACH41D_35410 [Streptomyces globisporus]|uniref:hypothetical protein n=1 Tax=Streptomyces globisporus TaxID=1908 RepID=UPI0037960FB4